MRKLVSNSTKENFDKSKAINVKQCPADKSSLNRCCLSSEVMWEICTSKWLANVDMFTTSRVELINRHLMLGYSVLYFAFWRMLIQQEKMDQGRHGRIATGLTGTCLAHSDIKMCTGVLSRDSDFAGCATSKHPTASRFSFVSTGGSILEIERSCSCDTLVWMGSNLLWICPFKIIGCFCEPTF